jgi:hypothetical protein
MSHTETMFAVVVLMNNEITIPFYLSLQEWRDLQTSFLDRANALFQRPDTASPWFNFKNTIIDIQEVKAIYGYETEKTSDQQAPPTTISSLTKMN